MNEKFFDLKKEKQDRIIGAAIRVFAGQEYRHASTDDIVREAGISKGLIFHYFDSKLGLYAFVYEYSVRFLALELRSVLSEEALDFFGGLVELERARAKAVGRYPYILQFLHQADAAREEEISEIVKVKSLPLRSMEEEIYHRICEGSALPEGHTRKVLEMVETLIRGIVFEECARGRAHTGEIHRRVMEYLELLRAMLAEGGELVHDME